jgi:hypothetical protein
MDHQPQVRLQPGDVMVLSIGRVGTARQHVIGPR